MTPINTKYSLAELARITALVVIICTAFAVSIVGLWNAADAVFALGFGILIAVIFDAGARGLGYLVPWNRRLRLLIVIVLAFGAVPALIWWGGTVVVTEAKSLAGQMHELFRHAEQMLRTESRAWFPGGTNAMTPSTDVGVVVGGAATVVRKLFKVVTFFVVAMFVGAFCAWEPQVYKAAFLSLLPRQRRPRVSEVMDRSADAMRGWLIGRGIAMFLIFLFTFCALTLIQMPNSVLLAVQAGVLTFIPTLGPFVAGIVIILAGLAQSPSLALYAVGTYVTVQFLESHVITPLVQRRTIRIPPAITLALQLIGAILFGLFAVIVIVPLAAAGKVFVEELYVNDRLGGAWERDVTDKPQAGALRTVLTRLKLGGKPSHRRQ